MPAIGSMENDAIHELIVHLLKRMNPKNYRGLRDFSGLIMAMSMLKHNFSERSRGKSNHAYRERRSEYTASLFAVVKYLRNNQAEKVEKSAFKGGERWGLGPDGAKADAASLARLARALRPAGTIGLMRMMESGARRKDGSRPPINLLKQKVVDAPISWGSICSHTFQKSLLNRDQFKRCMEAGCNLVVGCTSEHREEEEQQQEQEGEEAADEEMPDA